MKLLPYQITDKDGRPYIQVTIQGKKKQFSPEEISAMILTKMKEVAEAYLGKKVRHANTCATLIFSLFFSFAHSCALFCYCFLLSSRSRTPL